MAFYFYLLDQLKKIFMNDFDIVIVGAGISGSVLAERYANKLNKKVLIIEKRNHIGGNCYDYYNQCRILTHKYGPHFFHTNNKVVWDYISSFTKWHPYEHRVLSSVDNSLVPIPVNIDSINILFKTKITNSSQMLAWLKNEIIDSSNPKNSEEAALARVGKRLYKKLFRNYTIKQWGINPKEIHPSVMNRIPIHYNFDDRYFTDKYQAMPKNGYSKIFNRMLENKNIKVLLNTDFYKYKNKLKKFGRLFFTGPIDRFFEYKYGKLQYRSLLFKDKNIEKEFFQTRAQINYPNNYRFTRITEIKHATGQKINSTSIIYEYPRWSGEPFYPILNETNQRKMNLYSQQAKKLKSEGIFFIGRLANYIYINMDKAFDNALNLFKSLNQYE